MNRLQRAEYVTLRLIRRFLFNESMANRLARWLPYYTSSANESQPKLIVDQYLQALRASGLDLSGMRVLEVGAGRTNVVACALVAAGARMATALEPFVPFDTVRDAALRASVPQWSAVSANSIARATDFAEIPAASIDLLLSNSVLEHVRDLQGFLMECHRVLTPDGVMLHRVDYRDHFFKYPFAFLTFSETTWSRWLDPGDLPRWRLPDHVAAFTEAGFTTTVSGAESATPEFDRIRLQLAGRFAKCAPGTEVTAATLLARPL